MSEQPDYPGDANRTESVDDVNDDQGNAGPVAGPSNAPAAGPDNMSTRNFALAHGRNSADQSDAAITNDQAGYTATTGFHATTEPNADLIANSGLDPSWGGTGASAIAAGEPVFDGQDFQGNSQGRVHYTPNLEWAQRYQGYVQGRTGVPATVLGVNAEGTGHADEDLSREGLDLAIDPTGQGQDLSSYTGGSPQRQASYSTGIENDPDDAPSFRTTDPVPPENIAPGLNVGAGATASADHWVNFDNPNDVKHYTNRLLSGYDGDDERSEPSLQPSGQKQLRSRSNPSGAIDPAGYDADDDSEPPTPIDSQGFPVGQQDSAEADPATGLETQNDALDAADSVVADPPSLNRAASAPPAMDSAIPDPDDAGAGSTLAAADTIAPPDPM